MNNTRSLYHIAQEILDLHRAAFDADDETYDDLMVQFVETKAELKEKLLNIGHVLLDMEGEASKLRNEEKRLAERRRAIEGKHDRLLAYVGNIIGEGNDFQTSLFSFKWKSSKAVELTREADERPDLLPEAYQRIKIEANKALIGEDLKAGANIPYARLADRWHLSVK